MGKPKLYCVVGPTASGKTAFAIDLARLLHTEIVSADSRQFYAEMNIGTAKPSQEELLSAKHHFIGHISVKKKYSSGQFELEALPVIEDILNKNQSCILVGGSGLYINSVLFGIEEQPKADAFIRNQVEVWYQNHGLEGLVAHLKQFDLKGAQTIDLKNPQRVMRALEICLSTNQPFSSFRTGKNTERNFEPITIGLMPPREILDQKINTRVDQMIQQGLLNEVEQLFPFRSLIALKTVGYTEIFEYLDHKISLQEAIEEIKKNTRQYARRQVTWFNKICNHWIDPSKTTADQIIDQF